MEKQWFYIFTFQFSTKTDQYKSFQFILKIGPHPVPTFIKLLIFDNNKNYWFHSFL